MLEYKRGNDKQDKLWYVYEKRMTVIRGKRECDDSWLRIIVVVLLEN